MAPRRQDHFAMGQTRGRDGRFGFIPRKECRSTSAQSQGKAATQNGPSTAPKPSTNVGATSRTTSRSPHRPDFVQGPYADFDRDFGGSCDDSGDDTTMCSESESEQGAMNIDEGPMAVDRPNRTNQVPADRSDFAGTQSVAPEEGSCLDSEGDGTDRLSDSEWSVNWDEETSNDEGTGVHRRHRDWSDDSDSGADSNSDNDAPGRDERVRLDSAAPKEQVACLSFSDLAMYNLCKRQKVSQTAYTALVQLMQAPSFDPRALPKAFATLLGRLHTGMGVHTATRSNAWEGDVWAESIVANRGDYPVEVEMGAYTPAWGSIPPRGRTHGKGTYGPRVSWRIEEITPSRWKSVPLKGKSVSHTGIASGQGVAWATSVETAGKGVARFDLIRGKAVKTVDANGKTRTATLARKRLQTAAAERTKSHETAGQWRRRDPYLTRLYPTRPA